MVTGPTTATEHGTVRTICRVCGSKNTAPFFDLGRQPLANSLPANPDEPEETYPLALSLCADCRLVELDYTVNPECLFAEYVWVTGTSKGAREYAKRFYDECLQRVSIPKDGYVLEIASNDGTFLKPFIEKGHAVLGIDPAENIAKIAEKDGVPTRAAYWGGAEAARLRAERGPSHLIFARNVLPHVANTVDFVRGLRDAVHDDGMVVIEAHDAAVILRELHYDSIYHEHLCYFTLRTLGRLLSDAGLHIFDIMRSPISGGSMVVFARPAVTTKTDALKQWEADEETSGANDLAAWQKFAACSRAHKEKLLAALAQARTSGGTIIGWGASARSSTMLNFAGIGTADIQAIIDLNPLKQGRFTAGTHIPIVNAEAGLARKPTHICILAWNFSGEIMESLRQTFGFKGTCIVPLPGDPRVVTV